MDGITGLQLLDTATKSIGGNVALFFVLLLIGVCLVLLGVCLVSEACKNGMSVDLETIPITIGTILIVISLISIFTGEGTKEYKEYRLSIVDENYHIDLEKYEILKIEGKLITLEDKIN